MPAIAGMAGELVVRSALRPANTASRSACAPPCRRASRMSSCASVPSPTMPLVVCPNFVSVGRFVEMLLKPMRVDADHGMRGSVVVARYGSPFLPSFVTMLYRDEPLAAAFHMPFCSRVLAVE